MDEPILSTIKSLLSIEDDASGFDEELLILIASSFAKLCQLGVGPKEGVGEIDENTTWGSLINDSRLAMVKEFVYLDVRLSFDPPTASTLTAFENKKKEVEWRAMIMAEELS